ncbi:MAG: RNA-binding S4 domain-containing protein [Synechococcales bacterium]|nr:RNA-binding S4 domain-containing protein [Synechococcales bacterium]
MKLDQFLKWVNLVPSGGQAKLLIQAGEVEVNGEIETRRGRKLRQGDRVTALGESFEVNLVDDAWA